MMIRCLGQEEPSIVSMAVKPGIVDTQMAASVLASEAIPTSQKKFMQNIKKLSPDIPAAVIADLSINSPPFLSGKFFSFDQIPSK